MSFSRLGFWVLWPSLLFSLLMIFSLADIEWNNEGHMLKVPAPLISNSHSGPMHDEIMKELIKENFKKVNEEIKQNSEYMNTQFNKKFILVGGLLSFIVLLIKDGFVECFKKDQSLSKLERYLIEMCKTDIIWIVLALAVIICISIDIQERSKTNVANAHGAWIARFIEDPVLDVNWKPESDAQNPAPHNAPLNGWESFLRLRTDSADNHMSGFHHDSWGRLLFGVQFHYLTIVLYIIYIALLHFAFPKETNLQEEKQNSQLRHKIALGILFIVQVSILSFTIISRHFSEVFKVNVSPFPELEYWKSGLSVDFCSLVIGIVPTILLVHFMWRLHKGTRHPPNQQNSGVQIWWEWGEEEA